MNDEQRVAGHLSALLRRRTSRVRIQPNWEDVLVRAERRATNRGRMAFIVAAVALVAGPLGGFAVARALGDEGGGPSIVAGGSGGRTPAGAGVADTGECEAPPSSTTVPDGDVIVVPPLTPSTLPEPDGPPPADEAQAREEVIEGLTVAYAGASAPEERLSRIDDSEGLEGLREEVLVHFPQVPLDEVSVRVEEVRFLNATTAAVRYTIILPGYSIPEFPNRIGRAVLVDDTWKVTRDTVCHDLALGGVTCPP